MANKKKFVPVLSNLRSKKLNDFLCEAFECKPFSIELIKLSEGEVLKIKRELQFRSKSRTKPRHQQNQPVSCHQLLKLRRQDENVFTPPVPYPSNEVEVGTVVDSHYPPPDEFYLHVKRIRMEHDYFH